MANNFLENFRNTIGVQTRPFENISSGFSGLQKQYSMQSDSDKPKVDSTEVTERRFIRPLIVQDEDMGSNMIANDASTKKPPMKIWRLDGQQFNLNQYLDRIQGLRTSVDDTNNMEELKKVIKNGTNDWMFNNYVLGHSFSRANDIPDSTIGSVLRDYLSDLDNNKDYDSMPFEKIKSIISNGIEADFIPRRLEGGDFS